MEIKSAVPSLSALAHEGRLATFRLLVQAGPEGLAAGEIARRLDVLPNTLSSSLNILAQVGLVRPRREGRSIIYTADYEQMATLMGFLIQDCCSGHPEICAPLAVIASEAACCTPSKGALS